MKDTKKENKSNKKTNVCGLAVKSACESFEKELRVASDEDLGERIDQRIVGQGVHLLVFGPREVRAKDDREVGCSHEIGRGIVGDLNGKKDVLSTLSQTRREKDRKNERSPEKVNKAREG